MVFAYHNVYTAVHSRFGRGTHTVRTMAVPEPQGLSWDPHCALWQQHFEGNKPWLEWSNTDLQGYTYRCVLCRTFASGPHLVSKQHLRRRENHIWYQPQPPPPSVPPPPPGITTVPPPVPPAPASPPTQKFLEDRVAQLELVVDEHEAATMALTSALRALQDNVASRSSTMSAEHDAGESASNSGLGDFQNVEHDV